MKKLSFFFLIAFASLLVYSCEPAKKGGGDIAPSNFNDGAVEGADQDHSQSASEVKVTEQDSTKK
ncbi:MAG: hypothetical protein IPP77_09485 [Bacteroidetes bacterium]|nr:hypothetical protein [Bacteroidota bacterium]